MIQDIEPYVYNNAYDPKAPDKDSFVLYCHDMEVLVKYEGKEIAFPTFGELEKLNPDIYETCKTTASGICRNYGIPAL